MPADRTTRCNGAEWRTAALLAGGLLVAHVAAQALQIHRANKQIAALDTEIAQVYATAMPAEPMHEPRKQMQSRLDRIRKSWIGPNTSCIPCRRSARPWPECRRPRSRRSAIGSTRST